MAYNSPQKSGSFQDRQGPGGGRAPYQSPTSRLTPDWLKGNIKFETPGQDLFSDEVAGHAAEKVHEGGGNKRTQLRRFYDELVMWNDRVEQVESKDQPDKYQELAPFIKMLKAKVVYARGRGYVDKTFEDLFSHCLNEIKDPKTLRHGKLFMEAFMGFYRQYGA
jgi:CRISPR-associated protein Csm2